MPLKFISWRPETLELQVAWGKLFLANIAPYMVDFAILQSELDTMRINVEYAESATLFKQHLEAYGPAFTVFYHGLFHTPEGKSKVTGIASSPVLGPPPAGWNGGWFDDAVKLVERIRSNTEKINGTILKILGIANQSLFTDPATLKPLLRCRAGQGGVPSLTINLQGTHAANVYLQNTAGAWVRLGTSTAARYLDPSAMPAAGFAEVRKYRVRLTENNIEIGSFSEVINFTVTGV